MHLNPKKSAPIKKQKKPLFLNRILLVAFFLFFHAALYATKNAMGNSFGDYFTHPITSDDPSTENTQKNIESKRRHCFRQCTKLSFSMLLDADIKRRKYRICVKDCHALSPKTAERSEAPEESDVWNGAYAYGAATIAGATFLYGVILGAKKCFHDKNAVYSKKKDEERKKRKKKKHYKNLIYKTNPSIASLLLPTKKTLAEKPLLMPTIENLSNQENQPTPHDGSATTETNTGSIIDERRYKSFDEFICTHFRQLVDPSNLEHIIAIQNALQEHIDDTYGRNTPFSDVSETFLLDFVRAFLEKNDSDSDSD